MKNKSNLNSTTTYLIAASCVALIGAWIFYGGTKTSNPVVTPEILRVGTNVGYPPFVYADHNGAVIGFDIDIAQKIADQLGKQLVIENMSFDSLIVALKQGKVDMIIGGISITPSRLNEINLIPYYSEHNSALSLVFWGDAPAGLKTPQDIKTLFPGQRPIICTQAGSTFESYLQQWNDFVTPKTLNDIDDVLLDVRYGKSFAALLEPAVAHKFEMTHPMIRVVTFELDPREGYQGNGIGISKDNADLTAKVGTLIENLKKSGEIQQLATTWFVKK